MIDGHADILYRMAHEQVSFYDVHSPLQQSNVNMLKSGVDIQVFATFVAPDESPTEQLYRVLDSLHRFHTDVERADSVWPIYDQTGLQRVLNNSGAIRGALLSIEGADCLNGHLSALYALFQLGVRMVGLTWNHANCVADGVKEPRAGGLTGFGHEVVQHMQSLGMIVDVSHLSEQGVWDVVGLAQAPVIASHSNAKAIYNHPRNLTDKQIRAIAETGGVVGVTFVPQFIGTSADVRIDDLLRHLEHMLIVAGSAGVALGSDFDGIDQTMTDLKSGVDYPLFLSRVEDAFGSDILSKVAGDNLLRVMRSVLP